MRELTSQEISPAARAFAAYFLVVMAKGLILPSLNGVAFWLFDIFCFIIVPAGLFFYLKLPVIPRFSIQDHDSTQVQSYRQIAIESAAAIVCIYLAWRIGSAVGRIAWLEFPELLPQVHNYKTHVPKEALAGFIVAMYFAITAGVVEEYFFRGLTKNALDIWSVSQFNYVVLSSVLFASVHWAGGLSSVVASFFVGVLLALLYLCIKTIVPLMIAHTVFDFWIYS